MTEQDVKIPIAESQYIYGVPRGSYKDPLIILCHGYGGWMHEMLLYNGARHFDKHKFSTLRLSMYGGGESSRDIAKSDLMTHQADIDSVVSYAREQGASWVGVVGHSFSGLAIVYSKEQNFNAAALWDPTHTDGYKTDIAIKDFKDNYEYVESQDAYVSGLGGGYVYAKTIFENDYLSSDQAAAKFTVPSIVVNASWSKDQQEYGRRYAATIAAETEHVVIPDSSHPFTEDGAAAKLFDETAKFFKRQVSLSEKQT